MTLDQCAALEVFDTPTICNALELIVPATRMAGYTTEPLVAAPAHWNARGRRAVCAPAATLRIASRRSSGLSPAQTRDVRADYYAYLDANAPCLLVVEDTDEAPLGAFWGEVNTALHRALGVRGAVTNGVIRDLADMDPDFLILAGRVGVSHAHVHWVDYGKGARVFGMDVRDGQIVHADQHGAVTFDAVHLPALGDAIATMQARERPFIDLARGAERIDLDELYGVMGLEARRKVTSR